MKIKSPQLIIVGVAAAGLWLSTMLWAVPGIDQVASLSPAQNRAEGDASVITSKVDRTRFRPAPEVRTDTWLNGAPTSLAELRGQVVLVEFWTFGCINCRNVIPSLKELHRKYAARGLTILGVHAPEFDHERQLANVQEAIQRFGLPYRVALDNDFSTWNAYRNHYWPSLYLIDKEGYLRFNHIGEGEYDKIDAAVQLLLSET